jgi:hypothetical protein
MKQLERSQLESHAAKARSAAAQRQQRANSRRANIAAPQGTLDAPAAVVQRTTDFLGALQLYCAALTARLPLPTLCCSNPACANMCGLSEQQLVGGGSSGLCACCSTARYCSALARAPVLSTGQSTGQRASWKQEKKCGDG